MLKTLKNEVKLNVPLHKCSPEGEVIDLLSGLFLVINGNDLSLLGFTPRYRVLQTNGNDRLVLFQENYCKYFFAVRFMRTACLIVGSGEILPV